MPDFLCGCWGSILIPSHVQNKHFALLSYLPIFKPELSSIFSISPESSASVVRIFSKVLHKNFSLLKEQSITKAIEEFFKAVQLVECASCRCLHSSRFLSLPSVFLHPPHNLHEGCVLHLLSLSSHPHSGGTSVSLSRYS